MPTARSRRGRIPTALLFFCSVLCLAGATELKIPPSPDRWVTDAAGFLSPAAVQDLDLKLEAYEQQTGHQVLVYIGKTTESYPIEEFAARAFQAWKVGRKGLDDGLVLFIMAEDRAVRIEVGYGLEGVVPDITAGHIINDILIPKIRDGDPDGAVRDAVTAIIGAISGTALEEPSPGSKGKSSATSIFIIIAAVIFLLLFITNPSLALWLLINIMSGRGGGGARSSGGGWGSGSRGGSWGGGSFGGGSRGGGGFRGGGGRSGGGGASGRW